jgi:hypothetical protein
MITGIGRPRIHRRTGLIVRSESFKMSCRNNATREPEFHGVVRMTGNYRDPCRSRGINGDSLSQRRSRRSSGGDCVCDPAVSVAAQGLGFSYRFSCLRPSRGSAMRR